MITHPILKKLLYGPQGQTLDEEDEEMNADVGLGDLEKKYEVKGGSEEADDEGEKDVKVRRKKQIKKRRSRETSRGSGSDSDEAEPVNKKKNYWIQR